MKNYYEILEVKETASQLEIERAYKSIIKRYNPNDFSGEARKVVEKRLADVKEAYSILSDEFLKKQYNKDLGLSTEEQKIEEEKILKKIEELEERNAPQKKKKSKGMFQEMSDLSKNVISNLPEIKLKKPSKTGILALLAAIGIVVAIGAILYFIPFTNGFMKSFLLMK